LADRARELGLQSFMELIISSGSTLCLQRAVDVGKEGIYVSDSLKAIVMK
jgi:hypothetical protein